jgi:DNA-binding protein HU-beta
MNKARLIEKVSETLGSRALAVEAVELVLDTMVREIASGGRVAITGFGTLDSVAVSARQARNPATGETVQLAATRRVRFRAGRNLADLVTGAKKLPTDVSAIKKAPKGSVGKGASQG